METVAFSAICALRMRVNMSEIGSLMLIVSPLPACLDHTGDFAAHRVFAQLAATQAEFAERAARTPRQRTAVAQTHRAGIARKRLQLLARLGALFVTQLDVGNDRQQLRALGSKFLHCIAALLLTVNQCNLSHIALSS